MINSEAWQHQGGWKCQEWVLVLLNHLGQKAQCWTERFNANILFKHGLVPKWHVTKDRDRKTIKQIEEKEEKNDDNRRKYITLLII